LQTINEINQHYDPMQYVLLFPSGDAGWNINAATADNSTKVTIMQFYRFHLMYRAPTATTTYAISIFLVPFSINI
jgi:hypothetical protein